MTTNKECSQVMCNQITNTHQASFFCVVFFFHTNIHLHHKFKSYDATTPCWNKKPLYGIRTSVSITQSVRLLWDWHIIGPIGQMFSASLVASFDFKVETKRYCQLWPRKFPSPAHTKISSLFKSVLFCFVFWP